MYGHRPIRGAVGMTALEEYWEQTKRSSVVDEWPSASVHVT